MPVRNYRLRISENCFGKRSDQQSVKDGLGGDLYNMDDAVNNYKKSEQKWNRELIALGN